MKYTLTIITENKPGVLYRIADVFLRRKVNIESLTVAELPTKGTYRFTVVLNIDEEEIDKVVKQIRRIIEVIEVNADTDEAFVFNEIALMRIVVTSDEEGAKLQKKVLQNHGRLLYNTAQEYIVEVMGTEEDVATIVKDFQQFTIKDIAISGRTAIKK